MRRCVFRYRRNTFSQHSLDQYSDLRFLPVCNQEYGNHLQHAASSLYLAQDYWNRMEHRPLDGFVFAVAPFNFCALGAISWRTRNPRKHVLFKPSLTAAHESWLLMKIYEEAGLPPGVINFIPCDGPEASKMVLPHKDLAASLSGSTGTFQKI